MKGCLFAFALLLTLSSGIAGTTRAWDGAVRISPQFRHHFMRPDGSHAFIFNKTAWHYFTARDPQITR